MKEEGKETKGFHFVCLKCQLGIEVQAADPVQGLSKAVSIHDAFNGDGVYKCSGNFERK